MSKHISDKRDQVLSVQELLKNSKLSDGIHDSTIEPFFQRREVDDYIMNFKEIPELPKSLNREIVVRASKREKKKPLKKKWRCSGGCRPSAFVYSS